MLARDFQVSKNRAIHLLEQRKRSNNTSSLAYSGKDKKKAKSTAQSGLPLALHQAGASIDSFTFLGTCLLLTAVGVIIASKFFPAFLMPLYGVLFASLPFFWLERRITERARSFAIDFPSALLGTASSIKVGVSPLSALERSVKLLTTSSPVRLEVEKLHAALTAGESKTQALQNFATSYRVPELALFRSAFGLVLDHGGQFSSTLERLSKVTKDRYSLISSALVSTTTMRMTANFLLGATPLILLMVSQRSEKFWDTIFEHPIANTVASIGFSIIVLSLLALRRMSSFKP